MNELLKKYLFRFLRSPDYVTDVNFYLPKFLKSDAAFSETQRVLSWEHEQYRLKIIDFAKQFQAQTATWGLKVWEEELGLPTDLNADLELRRAKVLAKLLGTSPMTVANTNKLINLFTDDGKGYVDELPEPGTLRIVLPSEKVFSEELRDALDEMLPAHLVYYLQHIIDIGDDDVDDTIDVSDESSTSDGAFFMQGNFPIFENIPYGNLHNAPKYDGEIRVAPSLSEKYDGEKTYSESEITGGRYYKPFQWWFEPNGESFFNKEFQHDGAIQFDGLKPQTIKYDDGIDELGIVEVKKVLEDEVREDELKFNGTVRYNGRIKDDRGGDISITRYSNFNGVVKYDGGDLNFFNGALKANGKFKFTGDGKPAKIETLTDDISGNLSNVRAEKEKPLGGNIYSETYEYVPIVIDKNLNLLNVEAITDEVEEISESRPLTAILKVIRYDGTKKYNGGDLNFFDGSIKADGKFEFEGGGNRAKVKIISVDLYGDFSYQRPKKNTPLPYAEEFDFVPKVSESAEFSTQTNFEEVVTYSDSNGSLSISQKARFDGNLNYRGYFENKIRKFDGGLNYNQIFRVELDGRKIFNGAERYGGRKNSSIIDYTSDLDGKERIIDLEKITVASKEKLGYVIIGSGIELDNGGKISLPEQKFLPISNLKNIFENWRKRNEN